MSLTADTIDRLKAQLLTSNLSQRNQTLYQVINQLIDALREGLNEIETQLTIINNSSSSSSGGGTIITSASPLGDIGDDNEPDWNWGPQGLQGIQGKQGNIGPQGLDGDDGEDGMWGPPGLTGPQGPQGIQGPVSFVPSPDGCDCDCESMPFVGNIIIP